MCLPPWRSFCHIICGYGYLPNKPDSIIKKSRITYVSVVCFLNTKVAMQTCLGNKRRPGVETEAVNFNCRIVNVGLAVTHLNI